MFFAAIKWNRVNWFLVNSLICKWMCNILFIRRCHMISFSLSSYFNAEYLSDIILSVQSQLVAIEEWPYSMYSCTYEAFVFLNIYMKYLVLRVKTVNVHVSCNWLPLWILMIYIVVNSWCETSIESILLYLDCCSGFI